MTTRGVGRGTGEMAVLCANGLAVKSVETLRGDEPPRLRLISANPACEPYACPADEGHIVGTVPWTVRRM